LPGVPVPFEQLAAELGQLQPLNNNDYARFAALVHPHGLDLAALPPDEADAAVRHRLELARWWSPDETQWRWPSGWAGSGWSDMPPDLRRLDPTALVATVRELAEFVRDGWLLANSDEKEPMPDLEVLVFDLVGALREWVTGTVDAAPILAYSNRLPLQECDGEELSGHLILVGARQVGILLADYSV
jgi:hypothetical protein